MMNEDGLLIVISMHKTKQADNMSACLLYIKMIIYLNRSFAKVLRYNLQFFHSCPPVLI